MEWFKELLGDIENADDIVAKFKQEFPKHAVPKEQYSKKTDELVNLQEQLDKSQKDIEELSKSTEDAESYKSKLEEISKEFDTFKTETSTRESNRVKVQGLSKAFKNAGAFDEAIELLVSQVNLAEVQVNKKGEIVDADDLIASNKTKYKPLFTTKQLDDNPPPTPSEKPNIDEMTDAEYMAYKVKEGK